MNIEVLKRGDIDLNTVARAEKELVWHSPELVEAYEENLRQEYLMAVGYQGAAYWFMAGPGVRAKALLATVERIEP